MEKLIKIPFIADFGHLNTASNQSSSCEIEELSFNISNLSIFRPSTNYEENQEQIRWSLQDEHLLQERERQLPGTITFHLRRNVLNFAKDTQSLLYYVYNTKPMLNAAPGEYLDFTVTGNVSANNPAAIPLRMDSLSNRKKKQFKERMRALRVRHKNKRKEDSKLIKPVKNPRYDDVYHEGIAWLDSLAGPQFAEGEYTVEFSDEVWKSATRKGEDVF